MQKICADSTRKNDCDKISHQKWGQPRIFLKTF